MLLRKFPVNKLRLGILKKDEAQEIKELLSMYKFNDYRAYRMLDKDKLKDLLFNQILDLSRLNKHWLIAAYEGEKIVGLVTLSLLPWDTKHFGFNMAKIDYLIGDTNQPAIGEKLLSYLVQVCKNAKIEHLSCRIDADNISGIHALEKKGFRFMDALVTYVFNRHKHKILDIKELCNIKMFKEKDLQVLVNIARAAFSKDRFHLDRRILYAKANNLFGEWIKNCTRGKYADRVIVAERDSQVVGFLTFKLNKELQKFTGYKIAGHGLSAVSPEAKGIYPGLVKAAIQYIALNYDFLEFDTQLNNYEVIKVWQKFGFDFIRVKYTFHNWLK